MINNKQNQQTQIDKAGSLHNVRLNIKAVFTTGLPSRTKEHCELVHSNKPTIAITIKQSAPTSRLCRGLFGEGSRGVGGASDLVSCKDYITDLHHHQCHFGGRQQELYSPAIANTPLMWILRPKNTNILLLGWLSGWGRVFCIPLAPAYSFGWVH